MRCGKPYADSAPCAQALRDDSGAVVVPVVCGYAKGCQHKGKSSFRQAQFGELTS